MQHATWICLARINKANAASLVRHQLHVAHSHAPCTHAVKLRFCPDCQDLLYPKEDATRRVLTYCCRHCQHVEDVPPTEWCVYRNEIVHTSQDKTVILSDVTADPTLPRTKEVRCPECGGTDAVFFSSSTEEGMNLFFQCLACKHRWKDQV